jgi:glyoxylase-like metal-dependent hydrolase (beta-lactamase superfamily II)
LIDAANEHEVLVPLATSLGVTTVLETHGHWDHVGAVSQVRDAGISVYVRPEDAHLLDSYDQLLDDDQVIEIGDLVARIIHTPGHTPGSVSIALDGTPLVFTGDTLFPGGPGATHFDGGDFNTIITSIEERLFTPFSPETIIWPGHGASSTMGEQSPHLGEWVARGW